MQRVWKIVLLVLTVVVIAAAGYVLKQRDPVPQAGQTPGYAAAPATSDPPSRSIATGAAASPTTVVFLGDDYTAGVGATSAAKGWTARVARALHLDATVVAEPDAGYAKAGAQGTSYAELVAAVVAAHPQVVVVSGGRNDVDDLPATLRTQTRALFARLHAKLPDARLLAVAPWWGDSPHPRKLAKVDAAVQAGVVGAGGTYLDVADPLLNHSSWMADAADPNDQGYAAIARSMIDALRSELPR